MTARLTVAVSTIGDRIADLTEATCPSQPGTHWLIIWQEPHDDVPAPCAPFLSRADVTLHRLPQVTGVAHSRNAAMAQARTPYLLFADDDMGFDGQGWAALLHHFDTQQDHDILCARLRTPEGAWRKSYGPDTARDMKPVHALRVGTPEIALRRDRIQAAGVQFDPDFGAGARYPIGDEAVFLTRAMRAGLRVAHVPISVGHHPADSSGTRYTPETNRARIAVFQHCFGATAPLMRLAFSLKNARKFPGLAAWLAFVFGRID